MTTPNTPIDPKAQAKPATPPAAAEAVAQEPVGEPKKKKKKAKYTRGLKGIQKLQKRGSRAQLRFAEAITDSINTWRKANDKSSRKRRDGAIRDFQKNWAKGVARYWRTVAKAPRDVTKAWKPFISNKGLVRVLFPFAPLFRSR